MKHKKHIIFITIISLIFYCRHQVINHNIPIANIKFVKIEKHKGYENSFFIYFSSDIELIDNLKKNHDAQYLECFFKETAINMNNFFTYKGYCLNSVRDLTLISKNLNEYIYTIKASFKDKSSNISGGKEKERIMKAITKIMNKNNTSCLSCVFTASAFMNIPKRYISNTMYIPKENIKKIMGINNHLK